MKQLSIFIVGSIFVFWTSAFADQYPMLENIRQVSVTIDHTGLEPNEPPINWTNLQLHIEDTLLEVGINIRGKGTKTTDTPELRITAKMLAVPDTEQFVFNMETSLCRFVYVADKSNVQILAPVWISSTIMQSAEAEDVNEVITKAALRQTGEFISAWKAAKAKTPAEPNDKKNNVRQNPAIQTKNHSPTAAATQQTYIASKNSKIFHLATCSTAKTISGENLVTFATRQEALDSGRRPCKKCNP